jgi:hypothetical protein
MDFLSFLKLSHIKKIQETEVKLTPLTHMYRTKVNVIIPPLIERGLYYTPTHREGAILQSLCLSVRPSVCPSVISLDCTIKTIGILNIGPGLPSTFTIVFSFAFRDHSGSEKLLGYYFYQSIRLPRSVNVIIPPLIERGLYCNHCVCPYVRPFVRLFTLS